MSSKETDGLLSSSNHDVKSTSDSKGSKPEVKRRFLVEPIACLLFFSMFLSAQLITNHITFRTCRSVLGEEEDVCRKLESKEDVPNSQELETKVQPFVAQFLSVKVMIEALCPAILSLFVGAWSDKHGRKKVILFSYSGFLIQYCIYYLLGSISQNIRVEWYWLASLPIALTGGNCILMSTLMSYITDIASPEDRGKRVANHHVAVILGVLLGSAVSGGLVKTLGTVNMFLISTISLVCGLLVIIYTLPESIKVSKAAEEAGLSDLFKTDMIKDMANSAFKQRKNHDRKIIWLIISTFAISIFMHEGTNVVFFLYLREKFNWKVQNFSIFIIIATVWMIIGTQLGLKLKSKYKMSDTVSGILAYLTLVANNLLNQISTKTWHLYAGIILNSFRTMPDASARSILATIVPPNEIGKINSLIASIQAMSALGAAPLYSWIYKNTLETNPGAYTILNACFYLLNALSFTAIHFLMEPSREKDESKKDESKEKQP